MAATATATHLPAMRAEDQGGPDTRVPKLGGHIATIEFVPGMGIRVPKTARPGPWSVWARPDDLVTRVADVEPLMRNLSSRQMTYSIFDTTGNLDEAFTERGAALDCLAGIAQAEPDAASEVYLVAQDDIGQIPGRLRPAWGEGVFQLGLLRE